MATLTTDPIIPIADAQEIFDTRDDNTLVYLINSLSAKARAFMGRVRLNEDLTTPIVERMRGVVVDGLYLHAPIEFADLSTRDAVVEVYSGGTVANTYSAEAGELVISTDDFFSRVDLIAGCFPYTEGGSFIEATYYGGWTVVPGDVHLGAIMQGRIDLKRMSGEVGMDSNSAGNRGSVQMDRAGVISEVADLWRPYEILI